jgi:hypothetical protein
MVERNRACQVQHCEQPGLPRIGTTINGGLFVLVDLRKEPHDQPTNAPAAA